MPAVGYATMNGGMAAQPNYYGQSQKRWSDVAAIHSTAAMVAGQLTPGRLMTDLCVVTLMTLHPNTRPGSERASSLRAFVQAVLDAAAVSADVVLLALYYLRKTAAAHDKEPLQQPQAAMVVDASGACVDGSDSTAPSSSSSSSYLSTSEDNAPATQLRVRFVAALTCAHKFDADAAYTTRTWADLGGLHPATVVRAERELLAQLEFALNVSRDALTSFREEISQWMLTSAAVDGQTSYVTVATAATAYEKPMSMPQPAFAYACQRMHGGMVLGRCGCVACVSYAAAATDTVSPSTSPSSLHAMWSAAHHQRSYSSGYDMPSWPATPTSALAFTATDDYFAASRYAYAHASAALQSGHGPFYPMPQPYQSQEASPVTYAAPAMMMPEPHTSASIWQTASNACYASSTHGNAAMVDYNTCFDTTLAANTAAISMMPQPVAFYAY
ncbi:hypothetical protein SYNPS1DRAFT_29480 [Syncephalis pseudoplumigaleata]|uniref:Cyclin N-terminal domain-containing protein n=1 Tax=Syncephalis pseudoplumigaleata TaxID=1712513 RepID=A0A4P9YZD7_9FUNG|nr:hypothetical protein SYNPS1DRAFT_29480 [Syncephalis pseudoplumigaleata]|eukprot:RKP24771.1 hypothetical protein SYNPS1DRAFT_29480 [Syncephalis pseudoplumigaleata]